MGEPEKAAVPRNRTWMRVALIVSLALNFLILGIVGGAVLSHERGGLRGELGPASFGPYGRAFDAEDRAALRQAIRAEAPRLRQNRQAVRQGFRDLLAALRTQPYDAAQVAAIIDRQQAHLRDQMTLMRGLMLDRVAAMTPEQRAAFADRLEAILRRGPPHDHPHGTGDR